MAIDFGDQGLVDSGRSSVAIPDTYVPIRGNSGAGDSAEQLARSLASLSNTFDDINKQQAETELQRVEVHTQRLRESLKGGIPTNDDVNNILSDVHPKVRARAAEDLGFQEGLVKSQEYLQAIPLTLSPEQSTAEYQKLYARAKAESGGNLSYQAGFLSALDSQIKSKTLKDGEARINEQKNLQLNGFGSRFYTTVKADVEAYKRSVAASPSQQAAIVKVATDLGINPADLATVISYETGGTFRPDKRGGMNKDGTGAGTFLGLIQFSPENQKRYGVHAGQTFEEQMGAVGMYLKDRGLKPGMDILDIYSTINAGTPGRYDARDVNGSVREHVERMKREHSLPAQKFLGSSVQVPVNTKVASADGEAVPTQTLSPLQAQIRQRFIELDTEYKLTGLPQNRERRDRAGDELRVLAQETGDETLLDALPPELLTDDERQKNLNVADKIRTDRKQAKDAAIKAAEDQRKADKLAAERELVQMAREGREPTPRDKQRFDAIDADIMTGWGERRQKVREGETNPKLESEKLYNAMQEMRRIVAQGGDPTQVDLSNILMDGPRKQAFDYLEQLKRDGGEIADKYYEERWKESLALDYGVMFGGLTPAPKTPRLVAVQNSFEENLEIEIDEFVKNNNRAPETKRERRDIFNKAREQTLKQHPPELFTEGRKTGKDPEALPNSKNENSNTDSVNPYDLKNKYKFGEGIP